MKKRMVGIVLATALLTGFVTTALAVGVVQEIKAQLRQDFTIIIDGKEESFADANGNTVYPILYNGTTYLPLRSIGSLMGKDVGWDGNTKTVTLSEPGKAEGNAEKTSTTSSELSPGGVFEQGKYINVANVQIMYNGKEFVVKNNRNDIIRISCGIVGVKKDGTYELLQFAAFGGVDEAQYEKDLNENGWATKHSTDRVRPGESLVASLTVVNFNDFGDEYIDPDVDHDGYYDIVFVISPQKGEKTVSASTDDPVSEVYKIKVG